MCSLTLFVAFQYHMQQNNKLWSVHCFTLCFTGSTYSFDRIWCHWFQSLQISSGKKKQTNKTKQNKQIKSNYRMSKFRQFMSYGFDLDSGIALKRNRFIKVYSIAKSKKVNSFFVSSFLFLFEQNSIYLHKHSYAAMSFITTAKNRKYWLVQYWTPNWFVWQFLLSPSEKFNTIDLLLFSLSFWVIFK